MSKSAASVRGFFVVGVVVCSPLAAQPGPATVDISSGMKEVVVSPPSKPVPQGPETYGTAQVTYVRIDAAEMDPIASNTTYSGINNFQLRYQTNVTGYGLMAPVHLPGGAQITYVELDFYDDTPVGEVKAALGVCDFTGSTCNYYIGDGQGCVDAVATVCSGNALTGGYSSKSTDVSVNGLFVDNYLKRYILIVGNSTNDGSTAISQVIVGYVLQVSPAPGGASFNDVPTTHPFFQYIQALYASGITGGCGAGNYCPDAPLTRGQMAVFLSKALGLQFN
jgi:hypothetical protein